MPAVLPWRASIRHTVGRERRLSWWVRERAARCGGGRQQDLWESQARHKAAAGGAAGGGRALRETGDRVRLDIPNRRLEAVVPDDEWAARRAAWTPPALEHQTPWQEFYRAHVGQLAEGGCLEFATSYHRVARQVPRDNH